MSAKFQLVDIFTKIVPIDHFHKILSKLGVIDPFHSQSTRGEVLRVILVIELVDNIVELDQ